MSETINTAGPLPPLKSAVEAIQIEHEGKPVVLLRDQEDLGQGTLALSLPGFLVAMQLDGRSTVGDVQARFSQSTGALVTAEEITTLVAELDRAHMLETAALAQKRSEILKNFIDSPVRPAVHMGAGYPDNPLELAAYLGGFFQHANGPKKEIPAQVTGAPPVGLLAPHIDQERGGPAYAWAYQALASSPPPDLIVSLGVAHASPPAPWTLTRKNYETPYGPMVVDKGLYDDFQSTLWYDGLSEEWVHRTEHSLEFQALWLKYLWREKTPPWLPILCSSFENWADDKAPSSVTTVDEALRRFGSMLRERQAKGQRILILGGVDLAHVGPRFGDDVELTPEIEKKIETEDRESLQNALKLDADAFYLSVIKDDHWRKVCGLSAIYSSVRLLREMSAAPGRLLTYGQAADPMGGIVSFASALFPSSLTAPQ